MRNEVFKYSEGEFTLEISKIKQDVIGFKFETGGESLELGISLKAFYDIIKFYYDNSPEVAFLRDQNLFPS